MVRVKKFVIRSLVWKLFKPGLAIWFIVDMISDVRQTIKYFQFSPYWNRRHQRPHKLHRWYFLSSLLIWFSSPLLYLASNCVGLFSRHNDKGKSRIQEWKSGGVLSVKICTVVLDGIPLLICAIIHSICVMYVKLPFALLAEALANLNWISKTWATVGQAGLVFCTFQPTLH